jgi:hypothetical protein
MASLAEGEAKTRKEVLLAPSVIQPRIENERLRKKLKQAETVTMVAENFWGSY